MNFFQNYFSHKSSVVLSIYRLILQYSCPHLAYQFSLITFMIDRRNKIFSVSHSQPKITYHYQLLIPNDASQRRMCFKTDLYTRFITNIILSINHPYNLIIQFSINNYLLKKTN